MMKFAPLLLAFLVNQCECQGMIDCPPIFNASKTDCYFFGEPSTWHEADKKCKAQGGLLYEPAAGFIYSYDPLLKEAKLHTPSADFKLWLGLFTDEAGRPTFSSNYGSAQLYPTIIGNSENKCFSIDINKYPNNSSSVVIRECDEQFSYLCVYRPGFPCYTCPWYQGQCQVDTNTCFSRNNIFIEDSFHTYSLHQCRYYCMKSSACKFFTYNQARRRCGLRFYNPGGVVISPGQVSGSKTGILSPNEVFVGRTEPMTNPFECQEACQKDPKCQSMTWNNIYSGNPNTCVFNYGPTVIEAFVGSGSGIISAPKFCPGDCLRREKTLPNYDFNGQEYPDIFF